MDVEELFLGRYRLERQGAAASSSDFRSGGVDVRQCTHYGADEQSDGASVVLLRCGGGAGARLQFEGEEKARSALAGLPCVHGLRALHCAPEFSGSLREPSLRAQPDTVEGEYVQGSVILLLLLPLLLLLLLVLIMIM